jgi:hypothetical protein
MQRYWIAATLAAALGMPPLVQATLGEGRWTLAAEQLPRREREVTIPAGTQLRLRLDTSHASNTSRAEDQVRGRLISPVTIGGQTVLPANAEVVGHVSAVRPAARIKGRAYLAVRFDQVRTNRESYRVTTRAWGREARSGVKKDAWTIAVPGAVGATVGAITGGKKGAAIGSAVGAGGGTGVVLATAGPEVRLPRGSTLLVRLAAPLTVRVPA